MSDMARKSGRGFLVIAGAKVWFLLTGAAINLGLPGFFASHPDQGRAAFGEYAIVFELVSLINMVIVVGTLQAVSKVVTEVPDRAFQVVRSASLIQLVFGVSIVGLFALSAPLIAEAYHDPGLAPYIRVVAGVTLAYCFYAVFVGYFNGLKLFSCQAILDICFATLKAVFIIGAVVAGFGVMGSVVGFVATALIMTVVAGLWVFRRERSNTHAEPRPEGSEKTRHVKRILTYMLALWGYTFFLNSILRVDIFLLKSISAVRFVEEAGLLAAVATERASELVGTYKAMANIARIPYQASVAIVFVAFPIISSVTFSKDRAAAKGYIQQSLRYSVILIASMIAVVIADRTLLVARLYPQDYGTGGDALLWLCLGMMAFALMFVVTTILIGAGKPIASLVITLCATVLSVVANQIALRTFELGPELLASAGMATLVATGVGTTLALLVIYKNFRAYIPWLTLLRVTAAATIIIILQPRVPIQRVGEMLGGGGLVMLAIVGLKMAIFAILFYALLYLFREFNSDDFRRLKSVFKRKSQESDE